jgi:hypothetical protein
MQESRSSHVGQKLRKAKPAEPSKLSPKHRLAAANLHTGGQAYNSHWLSSCTHLFVACCPSLTSCSLLISSVEGCQSSDESWLLVLVHRSFASISSTTPRAQPAKVLAAAFIPLHLRVWTLVAFFPPLEQPLLAPSTILDCLNSDCETRPLLAPWYILRSSG